MKLWEFIKAKMLSCPGQVVCENDAQMTYGELVIWAELFARKLEGIHCCAICCSSEMAASMALLGCFAADVTAVPLSVRYGEKHCSKILCTISPDAAIMDFDSEFQIYEVSDSQYIQPENPPALIMCTSGTKGQPKGAMLSEDNIITNVTDITDYFGIDQTDTILITRPLYHCAVLTGEFLTALVKGVKIRFYSGEFHPMKALKLVRECGVTAFCGTPTLVGMMARLKRKMPQDNWQLKHLCISGECMDRKAGDRIQEAFPDCNIYHVYGLTEAGPRVSYLPPELFLDCPDCVGIPLKSVSIKIVKANGTIARAGEKGILWVKGDNVMQGYYQNPEKTAEVLQDGWLCTGDVAVINRKGLLKIKGRRDNLIVKAGMNIYPAEIEAAVRMDERVKEVLVYGFQNVYGTQIGMKIVGEFTSVEEVKQLCIQCLPTFQVPASIELVEKLPRSGSGKIIRSI